jgi:predicted RNA binding protein YcfA (HicA-like mRNA interferase family)
MDAASRGVYYTHHTHGRDAMGSKELIKLLERAGFKLVGANGSHHKYRNSANVTVIVPHPKRKTCRQGLWQPSRSKPVCDGRRGTL